MATTQDRMISLLPYYLQSAANINKYYAALATMFDEIITVFLEIEDSRDLDKSTKFGLDILGDIVGEQRNGQDDNTFRAKIRTKIISNRSDGTIETLNSFGRLILGQFYEGIIASSNPAEIVLRYTFPLVSDPVGLMKKATVAGVKIVTQLDGYVPIVGTFRVNTLALTKKISSI